MAAALDAKQTITNYLTQKWYFLTYKFSIQSDEYLPEFRQQVSVLFSKPTKEMPCPEAIAQFTFFLDDALRNVVSFTIETDPHKYLLGELQFDLEKMIDQVIKRKMTLKKKSLVNLNDDFTNTRIPNAIAAVKLKEREQAKKQLHDQLMDFFTRKDQENQGKITFDQAKQVIYHRELPLSTKDRMILMAFLDMETSYDYVEYTTVVSFIVDAIDTIQYASANDSDEDISTLDQFENTNTNELEYTLYTFDQLVAASTTASKSSQSAETNAMSDNAIELTHRQLWDILESPLMVLSKNQINLILALAFPSETTFSSSRFESILQQVQVLITHFQKKLIHQHSETHIVSYLSKHFQNVERSTLKGSAQYLRHQISFFQLKQVLKDLRLLFLSPYQIMDLLDLSLSLQRSQKDNKEEEEEEEEEDLFSYEKFIPLLVKYLQQKVATTKPNNKQKQKQKQKLSSEWIEKIKAQLLCRFLAYDPEKKGTLTFKAFEESLSLVKEEEEEEQGPNKLDENQIHYLRTIATSTISSFSASKKILHPIQYEAFINVALPYIYYSFFQHGK